MGSGSLTPASEPLFRMLSGMQVAGSKPWFWRKKITRLGPPEKVEAACVQPGKRDEPKAAQRPVAMVWSDFLRLIIRGCKKMKGFGTNHERKEWLVQGLSANLKRRLKSKSPCTVGFNGFSIVAIEIHCQAKRQASIAPQISLFIEITDLSFAPAASPGAVLNIWLWSRWDIQERSLWIPTAVSQENTIIPTSLHEQMRLHSLLKPTLHGLEWGCWIARHRGIHDPMIFVTTMEESVYVNSVDVFGSLR